MSVIRSTPLRPSEQGPVLNLKGTPEAPHRDSLQRGQQRGGAALNERKTAGMKKALRAAAWRRAQARARPTQPSSLGGEFARLNPGEGGGILIWRWQHEVGLVCGELWWPWLPG